MTAWSDRRQHAGEDLETEVLLVAEPVRAALEDADLVVQPLDEAERDFVVRTAVGRDPVPVPVNHRGELLVGSQALPLERRSPVLEEATRPALPAVVPKLPERLFEEVGRVQPLVGREQGLERPPAIERQILAVGEQGVLLPFDEPALPPGHAGVLALADLIEGLAEMPQNVELVEQDAGLRGVARGRAPEGFPHVHDREADPGRFPRTEPSVELIQAAGKVYRVGLIFTTLPVFEVDATPGGRALLEGLRQLGYEEGRNLVLERRSAEGKRERYLEIAAELVRLKTDVILIQGIHL